MEATDLAALREVFSTPSPNGEGKVLNRKGQLLVLNTFALAPALGLDRVAEAHKARDLALKSPWCHEVA